MANDYAIRPGLLKKGYTNDDIGYDEGSGFVQLKGQNFLKPEMNVQGTTYTSQANFDNAYSQFDKSQKKQQYEQQVVNPTAYQDPYKQQKDSLLSTITAIMNQTAPDPYSTPQYAAAQVRAQQGAQQGIRSAQEAMGSAGFGRSTALGNAAQREQNDATQYLMTQVVPGIQQQLTNDRNQQLKGQFDMFDLYDKLTGNDYNLKQDQDTRVKDALDYILNEEATKKAAEEAKRSSNIKNAMDLSEQYGFGVLPKDSGEELFKQVEGRQTIKASTEQRQMFQEEVTASDKLGYVTPGLASFLGVEPYSNTLSAEELIADTAYKMGMVGVQNRQAATGERNAATSEANSEISRTNAETNRFNAETARTKAEQPDPVKPPSSNEVEAEAVSNLSQMTPGERAAFFEGESASIIKEIGITGFNRLYNMYFDELGKPRSK